MRYRLIKIEAEPYRGDESDIGTLEIPGEMPVTAFTVNVGNLGPDQIDSYLERVKAQMRVAGVGDAIYIPHRGSGTGLETYRIEPED